MFIKKPKKEFPGKVLHLVRRLKSYVEYEGLFCKSCLRKGSNHGDDMEGDLRSDIEKLRKFWF